MSSADALARVAARVPDSGRVRWFRAPGRVNLMGDHTDYNEGFVLPMAIDRDCVIAAAQRHDEDVRLESLDLPGDERPDRYVAEVARALEARGRPRVGMDAVLASDVPLGSGLSSSAAFEVACALALLDAAEHSLAPKEVALACQAAEQAATGVPSGVMDQLSSLCGRAGSALLVDCRSLDIEPVPMPDDTAILAVHSGVARTLAGSAYAERRAECERVAAALGLRSLRDATLDQVRDSPAARHVVTENERVLETVAALHGGDRPTVGRLFGESHASLRDDFAVSIEELDVLVEELVAAGADGARLTGAGFGGSVVAVCERGVEAAVGERAAARYRERTGRDPTVFVCRAVDGAGPLDGKSGR